MTERELREEFTKRIKRRLQVLQIDQRELSRRAGISEVSLSRYLKCHRKPTYDIVIRLAQALECKPSYLIDIDDVLR